METSRTSQPAEGEVRESALCPLELLANCSSCSVQRVQHPHALAETLAAHKGAKEGLRPSE